MRRLSERSRRFLAVRPWKRDCGILPVSLLLERMRRSRFGREAMESGMWPVRQLPERSRVLSFLNSPRKVRMWPEREVNLIVRLVRGSLVIEYGIVPVREGEYSILMLKRKGRSPIEGEMVPEMLKKLMSRVRTRLVRELQMTPGQEQQAVLEVHERSSGLGKRLRRAFLSSLWHLAEETKRGKHELSSMRMTVMCGSNGSLDMLGMVWFEIEKHQSKEKYLWRRMGCANA